MTRGGHREIEGKIIELVEQAIIVTDVDGVVTFMNPFAERLYGWEASDAVGRSVLDVTVPEVSREQAVEIMGTLRGGKSWSGEFQVQRRGGTRFTAAVTDTPVCDEQGQLSAIIGVSTDVTERRRAEDALHASQARFRALADEAPVGFFEVDVEGRLVYLNRMGQKILGLSREAALGKGWHDAIHPEDRERVLREWNGAIAASKVFASEYRLGRPDGQSVLVQGYARALRERGGRISGYIGAILDITGTRALQTQVALGSRLAAIGTLVTGAARTIGGRLAGSLSDQRLVLKVARALRKRLQGGDPLDRLTEVHVIDELIQALVTAQEGGQRIARLVKDLAIFADSAPGRIRVRLFDIVNQAMHWLPASVAETTAVQVEKDGALEVRASAGQIEQVVVNLVSNAAKASPPGKGSVVLLRMGPGAPGMARLEVIDRGTGIDPAILERIFEPHLRTRDGGEGMGLGLAVSHAIVTAHGGTLTVESVVGEGSTFRVELPAAVAEPAT